MSSATIPLQIVPASVATYSLAHQILIRHVSPASHKPLLKAISGVHAAGMTIIALLALAKSPLRDSPAQLMNKQAYYSPDGNLDDSNNPIIQAQSDRANAITAWEAGYLIYDTWALIRYGSDDFVKKGYMRSLRVAAKKQPFEFAHHVGLAAALLYLQYYIWKGRERGVWIIVALTLMNASTPLLQARWWAAHVKGKRYRVLDLAFAGAFCASRMGTIAWVLQRYGRLHGLGAWDVYVRLRRPCQAGTGALFGLNLAWWVLLLRSIARKW